MGIGRAYLLRLKRRRLVLRSWRKARELSLVSDRLDRIGATPVLAVSVIRNERPRLEYFLSYYRRMGIGHFLFVDNASDDGSADFLAQQPDCSVWLAKGSYKSARFGMDWVTHLLNRHADGRWALVVDPDEFLVYTHCDTRPVTALTDWLDGHGVERFGTMLIDMYADGPVSEARIAPGQNPFEVLRWFDPASYFFRPGNAFKTVWTIGGPRLRRFFLQNPANSPALNKTPLVRWRRGLAFASSTHTLLPRRLNINRDPAGQNGAYGALLHAKLHTGMLEKASEEALRRQHYADGREYKSYLRAVNDDATFKTSGSRQLQGWQSLEECGLIASGGWF